MKKNRRAALMVVLIFAGLYFVSAAACLFFVDFPGYIRRHYSFDGYSDSITIFLLRDDEELPLPTDQYSVNAYGDHAIHRNENSYSMRGDYGTYFYTLCYQGKTASFFLENANDWWRTMIVLHIRGNDSLIEQTNCIFNNNPPFLEKQTVEWN